MREDDLQVFIDSVAHYFDQMSGQPARVGTPYLAPAGSDTYDYTGTIGISGKYTGHVYFTAPRSLLSKLLISIGEVDVSGENLCDLVGEVANTVSGNARRHFGKNFLISVPSVSAGVRPGPVVGGVRRCFTVPLSWQNHEAAVVISLH